MIPLCRRDRLQQGAALGIEITVGSRRLSLLLLDTPQGPRGYLNSCPHIGVRLDWRPHDFFDADGLALQCATHGARFEPENGRCFEGPCRGDALVPLALALRDDQVFLCDAESLPDTARRARGR